MENKHRAEEVPLTQEALHEDTAAGASTAVQGDNEVPNSGEGPGESRAQEELLQEELEALNDKHLRLMAEYENFRRRSQREKDAIYPQATASVVEKFLPILDSFDRALDAPCADEAFKKGLEMIFQNFMDVLTALGVEEYGVVGEKFDPLWHNGVARVENPDFGENEIADVYQKGYRLGEKILRTAMVVVAN